MISAVKLDKIGLSGNKSDVESLQMSHRIRLLCHRVQNSSGRNHQFRHKDRQGVDQRGCPPLRSFCLYMGRIWSNQYNLKRSRISDEINNKRRFIVW